MTRYTHPDLPDFVSPAAFTLGGIIMGVDVSDQIGRPVDGMVFQVVGDGTGAMVEPTYDEDGSLTGVEIIRGGWGYTTAHVQVESVDPDGGSWEADAEIGSIQYPRSWWRTVDAQEIVALGFVEYVPPEPEPPTPEQVIEAFRMAIQSHVDAAATAKLYDSGNSLATYVSSTNAQWAAEATAFVAWRDAVWAYSYAELDKVMNAEREQPTIEAFIAELPEIVWPV